MKVNFNYYLHDDCTHNELIELIASQTGLQINEMDADRIGSPFYEVTLHCELDTDTMQVALIGAEL